MPARLLRAIFQSAPAVWPAAGLLAAAVFLLAPAAAADDVPAMNPHLARQLTFLKARVMVGRIGVTTLDPTRSSNSSSRNDDLQERLALSYSAEQVTLSYEMTTRSMHLTIHVTDGREMIIRRLANSGAAGPNVEFIQPLDGSLSLRVGLGESQHACQGDSLWHLLLAEPDLCREHLLPLLQLLRPGWRLAEAVPQVEAALLRSAAQVEPLNRGQLRTLVAALSDERYVRREAAERQLRLAGPTILPLLRSVDRRQLDAEQAYRLRNVVRGLAENEVEDTPERVAAWLAGDPYLWYALVEREHEPLRALALDRLGRLLQSPVEFDAKADSDTRQRQLRALAEQIRRDWQL